MCGSASVPLVVGYIYVSATHPPTHLHLSGNAHLRELLALLQRLEALALRLSVEQPAIAGMYGVWAEEKQ